MRQYEKRQNVIYIATLVLPMLRHSSLPKDIGKEDAPA